MKCCKCGENVNQPHVHYVLDKQKPQRPWCINCASLALTSIPDEWYPVENEVKP